MMLLAQMQHLHVIKKAAALVPTQSALSQAMQRAETLEKLLHSVSERASVVAG